MSTTTIERPAGGGGLPKPRQLLLDAKESDILLHPKGGAASPSPTTKTSPSPRASSRFDDPMLTWREASPDHSDASMGCSPSRASEGPKSPFAKLFRMSGHKEAPITKRSSELLGFAKTSESSGIAAAASGLGDLVQRRHSATSILGNRDPFVSVSTRKQRVDSEFGPSSGELHDSEFLDRLASSRSRWREHSGPIGSMNGDHLQSQTHEALQKLLPDRDGSMRRRGTTDVVTPRGQRCSPAGPTSPLFLSSSGAIPSFNPGSPMASSCVRPGSARATGSLSADMEGLLVTVPGSTHSFDRPSPTQPGISVPVCIASPSRPINDAPSFVRTIRQRSGSGTGVATDGPLSQEQLHQRALAVPHVPPSSPPNLPRSPRVSGGSPAVSRGH